MGASFKKSNELDTGANHPMNLRHVMEQTREEAKLIEQNQSITPLLPAGEVLSQTSWIWRTLEELSRFTRPRTVLPGILGRIPGIKSRYVTKPLLKVWNYLARDQRAMNTLFANTAERLASIVFEQRALLDRALIELAELRTRAQTTEPALLNLGERMRELNAKILPIAFDSPFAPFRLHESVLLRL